MYEVSVWQLHDLIMAICAWKIKKECHYKTEWTSFFVTCIKIGGTERIFQILAHKQTCALHALYFHHRMQLRLQAINMAILANHQILLTIHSTILLSKSRTMSQIRISLFSFIRVFKNEDLCEPSWSCFFRNCSETILLQPKITSRKSVSIIKAQLASSLAVSCKETLPCYECFWGKF